MNQDTFKLIKRFALAGVLLWVLVIAAMGFSAGNKSFVKPNLDTENASVIKDQLNVNDLKNLVVKNNGRIQIVDFTSTGNCSTVINFAAHKCYKMECPGLRIERDQAAGRDFPGLPGNVS